MNKRIYVSIPYTGHEADFPARCKAAHEKYDAPDVTVITPKDVITDSATPYNTCMGKCMEILLGCDEAVFADGWAESKGCSLEAQATIIYGIPHKTDARI